MLKPSLQRRQRLLRQLAVVLLSIAVGVLAWFQFRWLGQLRGEEQSRRAVALRVSAANFEERVSRLLQAWLDGEAGSTITVVAELEWSPGASRGRLLENGRWRPAGAAEMGQRLGHELLAYRPGPDSTGIWLEPPALVRCESVCRAWLAEPRALAETVLGDTANRVFAEFGDELQVGVFAVAADDRVRRVLFPADEDLVNPDLSDVDRILLDGLPVLGPTGMQWRLRVNHDGSSLEAAVRRSHRRNLLLSLTLLALLGAGVVLVLAYQRRQSRLADQQLLFVASASHELRTPLSVIGSAADNLAEGAVSSTERVREYGDLIRSEVRKLASLIDNVLQFSESAARPIELQSLSPATLIEESLVAADGFLRGCERRVEVADDLPEVQGDPRALLALLVNLLSNAGKYAGPERWIEVSAQKVAAPRGRHALAISVVNPVPRLDSDPERWFEPFRRGRDAEARGIPGTGIGLAVARTIARQHGGGLAVQTLPPSTVRMTVYLPLEDGR